ncbi:MAG TPA: glycosyltransferase, partial [Bryobacteraceae bacterium]|nr:glycosyltransferase [Bryobacteraceae bacterium]
MHFLYHHRTTGRGAEGNHIMSVVRALEAEGHSVTILSPPGVDPRRTAGAVPLDKGATAVSGASRLWKFVSCRLPEVPFELLELAYGVYAFFRVVAAIRRERPAALYERYAFFLIGGVLAARCCRVPVILEVNEVSGVERARKQRLVRLAGWLERRIFRHATRILTVSSFLTERASERGGHPGAVITVPNAIDPARFEHLGAGLDVRRALGIDRQFVVGFVGWFDTWDRLDLLVDAFARVHAGRSATKLLLVGDGPATPALRTQIAAAGLESDIVLTGPVERASIPAYIDAMDLCVLADSNPYGSPMVLFEFMAMGKPVIAPRTPPVRDVVRDGENGWMIEPGHAA